MDTSVDSAMNNIHGCAYGMLIVIYNIMQPTVAKTTYPSKPRHPGTYPRHLPKAPS